MADIGKPLRLKDLLELDCDSCSAAGFRCYPRRLGESSPMPRSFCNSPSLRRSSNKLSHLSRSLSRRLRGSLWWRRSDEEEVDAALPGCGCGSVPDTSPSESSYSSGRTRTRPRSDSDSDFSSASSAPESMHAALATVGDEHEDAMKKRGAREEGSSSGSEVDDKEQLSPVAVLDFPCFDDDCSPSSDDSLLSRLQRERETNKNQLFESLDELGPVDLEARLAASRDPDDQDDISARKIQHHADETTPPRARSCHRGSGVHEEQDENGLLVLLMGTVSAGVDAVSERLLLDFFVEMKGERRSERAGLPKPVGSLPRTAERLGHGEILAVAVARQWLLDGAGWGLEDVLRGAQAVMAEMERGRRWMQVGEEERGVGTVVAGVLTDQLLDEVVRDLLV